MRTSRLELSVRKEYPGKGKRYRKVRLFRCKYHQYCFLSDYCAESKFSVQFDLDENGTPIVKNGEVIFKNLSYTITDESLIALVEQGKLKGAFIVECSASVYRSKFDISSTPYDLHVSAHEINGNVVASCYIYATEDIENFKSSGFISEYAGYSFDIDKFDILAVDDGYKFKIELDPTEDDKVASIFTIVKKEDDPQLKHRQSGY